MSRLRKAYHVAMAVYEMPPMLVFAPTASKARSEAYYNLSDVWGLSFKEFLEQLAYCRRAPGFDQKLPDPHPLRNAIPASVLHCVVHAYGGRGLKAGYRDHFYACETDWRLKAALYHGLFRVFRKDKGRDGRPASIMYELTQFGRNLAEGEVETYPRAWS